MLESKPAAEGFTAFHRLPRGAWEVGMERQPFPARTRRRSPGLGAPDANQPSAWAWRCVDVACLPTRSALRLL